MFGTQDMLAGLKLDEFVARLRSQDRQDRLLELMDER